MMNLLAGAYGVLDAVVDATVVLSYGNTGYRLRHALMWNPDALDVDLTGKVCAITGGNSGIGFATALQFAQRGATVYLLVRNWERGVTARASIIAQTGNDRVHLEAIDLSDLAVVRACSERLASQLQRLDVLINNAANAFEKRALSAAGVEVTFATNVLGPFALTNALLPLMQRGSRIINVSSGGMYLAKLDLNDILGERRHYDELMAYARSKRALMMLTELWAKQLAGTGITVNCMHPGWADTPLVQTGLPVFRQTMRRFLRTPAEGADTIVWLAAAREVAGVTGRFWFDRRARAIHKFPLTRNSADDYRKLWNECVRLTAR
jgi:NAD(P)-dependent dehydrogenase (short-subunit alcohol dehydrogenase family)